MSKVDALIQEFCPDGVEYMQLGDIEDAGLIKLGRGNVISKKDIAIEPGDYPIYSSSAAGVGEFGRYGKYMFDDERLSWSVDGGGRFFYRHAHKYSVTNVSGWLKVLDSSRIDIKYLFYALDSAWSTKKFDYTKKAHPSVIRNEYKIPVPPLEVQKEIVNILDKFTQLEAELSAELEARRKQYEYYRSQLVGKNVFVSENWVSLESVSTIKTGTKPKVIEKIISGIPYINAGNEPSGYTNDRNTDGGVITIPSRGQGSAGHVGWQEEAFWCGPLCYRVDSRKTVILNKFIYYYLKNIQNQIVELRKVGSIPAVNKSDLGKVMIPVPPILQQERIISILDNFDALVNDISAGLPAEINARRQQYEYYRTKLLTFQEQPA